ncbi:hypothetical protein EI94DRAFT_1746127, partial [Lactarius quietus]
PLNGQLIIPPYAPHNGQLWFPPPPPAYVGDPLYYRPLPLRLASANPSSVPAPILSGLPVSGTPDHQQQYHLPQPEQTIGHGALAARISHHLRVTSRARSVSPPSAPSHLPPPPPTQVEVELLSPKPMPSSKLISETTLSADPFAQSFGRPGTRTRSLSAVKLEEMAARAAAETEANLTADNTFPAPPVPSGKPLGPSEHRRLGARDIFANGNGHLEQREMVPLTPSLSALSLLRPPQRHSHPVLSSQLNQEDSGLVALEQRLVEQVGTRRLPPLSTDEADPPPPRCPPLTGAAVSESAISSLALGAEDFGGRNVSMLAAPAEGDVENIELESEDAKKAKNKQQVRDEEVANLKRAVKGRVAEWLEKLASPEQEAKAEQDARSPSLPTPEPEPEPASIPVPAPEPTVAPAEEPSTVVESKPNPSSSGFISVATLCRAPISLPLAPAPESTPVAPRNDVPPVRRVANRYPPLLPQVEMKYYDIKSARGGRGGRAAAVASIWAEATKGGGATGAAASTPKPAPVKPMTSIATKSPVRPAKDENQRVFLSRGRPPVPTAAPAKAEKEDQPPRVQRALFGLGVAAAATPSSPALSSSIATPVLSSTAYLAHPPGARARAPAPTPSPPSPALATAAPSPRPPPSPSQPQPAAAAGWRAPLVSGAGLKADLAFGQARLRDLIRRYQGQAA